MPKQVKIGFDKVPTPPVTTYHQLLDVRGTPLTDAAGNPLVTEDAATESSFSLAKNSLSTFVANKKTVDSIPVSEAFADASEVSATLLGVPRAEEQLSLFADVSTYGFDDSNWNHYRTGHGRVPSQWYRRKHPIYGRRGPARFYEETNEQALYYRSFPVQYKYPKHPKNSSADITDFNQYPHFRFYLNFIALGRWMYELWYPINPKFANDNFLPNVLTIIDQGENEVPIERSLWTGVSSGTGGFTNQNQMHDIRYKSDENDGDDAAQKAMDHIEQWTLFYYRIRKGIDTYPIYQNRNGAVVTDVQFKDETGSTNLDYVGSYLSIARFSTEESTRPGGDANNETVGVLETRKSFRYQPGRVSGFTFGVRLKNNLASTADKVEWGAANQTDQYMFQASGPNINIVRRSTVDVPDEVRRGMGLDPDDTELYSGPEVPPSADNSKPMYTMTIPRSRWNGDPLDGTGPSGHILDPEKVTMYKIEYSWYGAIGAKFYAYIPIENDECRWVLMHTLILENKLVAPVLQNADFKFRYTLSTQNTQDLTEPMYIYKYGSSYYIDGGDEGNITLSNVTSDTRTYINDPAGSRGGIVGLHTKKKILNTAGSLAGSGAFDGTDNNKKVYPLTLSAFSNNAVRIDVNKLRVSPDGHHASKTVSLQAGTDFEKDVNVHFRTRSTMVLTNRSGDPANANNVLSVFDHNAKVIGKGLFNVYAEFGNQDYIDNFPNEALVSRRNGNGSTYDLVPQEIGEKVLIDGEPVAISSNDTSGVPETASGFDAQLVGYRSVVASDTAIRSNRFKIHFLNPIKKDSRFGEHWADFAIGVTPDAPTTDSETDSESDDIGFLKFGTSKRVYPTDPATPVTEGDYFDIEKELHVEWTNLRADTNLTDKAEYREVEGGNGYRLEQDYRIRGTELPQAYVNSAGSVTTQGILGCVKGRVDTITYAVYDIIPASSVPIIERPPSLEAGSYRVIFDTDNPSAVPPINANLLGTAELGVNGASTGYVVTSTPQEISVGPDAENSVNKVALWVSPLTVHDQNLLLSSQQVGVQAKIITLEDDNKISSFDSGKDFTYRAAYKFNVQPLYLFVAMKSNARINNIIVEEITATGTATHIPNFLGALNGTDADQFDYAGKESSNIQIVKDALTDVSQSPSNFVPKETLSSIKYDTQTSTPLALETGTKLYSFYVGQNESVDFGLENIFNIDREYLTPGLYNNNAIYFSATPVQSGASADVQMTLTSKEQ